MRQQLLNEARTWLNTPYKHQGRLKGHGVDCVGVIVGVLKNLNLLDYDYTNYTRDPNSDTLIQLCNQLLIRIDIEDAQPGDILVMSWRKGPQHMAFLTDKGMLHAHLTARKVVEHVYDELWQKRTVAAYSIPGIDTPIKLVEVN